jgi:ABC-2 type transport system permease protein
MQFVNLSPLRWLNKAILEVIYSHDFSCVIPSVLINLGIAIIFTGITSYYTRKEAFLN